MRYEDISSLVSTDQNDQTSWDRFLPSPFLEIWEGFILNDNGIGKQILWNNSFLFPLGANVLKEFYIGLRSWYEAVKVIPFAWNLASFVSLLVAS